MPADRFARERMPTGMLSRASGDVYILPPLSRDVLPGRTWLAPKAAADQGARFELVEAFAGTAHMPFSAPVLLTRNLAHRSWHSVRGRLRAAGRAEGRRAGWEPRPGTSLIICGRRRRRSSHNDYPLGHSESEARRLAEQAALFEDLTEDVLRRAGIQPGMLILDLGRGVGDAVGGRAGPAKNRQKRPAGVLSLPMADEWIHVSRNNA
jgi:hypothetical protein